MDLKQAAYKWIGTKSLCGRGSKYSSLRLKEVRMVAAGRTVCGEIEEYRGVGRAVCMFNTLNAPREQWHIS